MFRKAFRPLKSAVPDSATEAKSSSTLKMEARHGCRSPVWKTTTSTRPEQTAPPALKISQKETQNAQNPHKKRPREHRAQIYMKTSRHRSKTSKRIGLTKPWAAFPRLSRHLELLPCSESFALDWRYFHLPHTQVMPKSHPFYYV